MPLVRIAVGKGRPDNFGARVGGIVHQAMVDTMKVPADDRFQVITHGDQATLVYDPQYLGIARTDGVVFIQVTLNEGRTLEAKQAFYHAVAVNLHAELGVRKEDVLINLTEVKKENWSFGNGLAQYAPPAG